MIAQTIDGVPLVCGDRVYLRLPPPRVPRLRWERQQLLLRCALPDGTWRIRRAAGAEVWVGSYRSRWSKDRVPAVRVIRAQPHQPWVATLIGGPPESTSRHARRVDAKRAAERAFVEEWWVLFAGLSVPFGPGTYVEGDDR